MRPLIAVAVAFVTALAGCGGEEQAGVSGPPPAAPEKIRLTSPAFEQGATIPERYTCEGDQDSPPLEWSGVPKEAKELALLLEDPDAPSGTFVHWTVYGIESNTTRINEDVPPPGSKEGANSFGDQRYAGPCPPLDDDPHRYEFTLYALGKRLDLERGASPQDVRAAIAGAALARGRLTGAFARD